jgi:hypothetical protein
MVNAGLRRHETSLTHFMVGQLANSLIRHTITIFCASCGVRAPIPATPTNQVLTDLLDQASLCEGGDFDLCVIVQFIKSHLHIIQKLRCRLNARDE